MKKGFLVRVCISCLEKKGTAYSYMSVYGCRNDDEVWSCNTCSIRDVCPVRTVNPREEDSTGGYCNDCVTQLIEQKSA
jgi:hypothetical protein